MTDACHRELLQLIDRVSEAVSRTPRLSLAEWNRWARSFRSGSGSRQTAEDAALSAHERSVRCAPGSRAESLSLAAAAVSWAVIHAMENREDLTQRSAAVAALLARVRTDSLAAVLLQPRTSCR